MSNRSAAFAVLFCAITSACHETRPDENWGPKEATAKVKTQADALALAYRACGPGNWHVAINGAWTISPTWMVWNEEDTRQVEISAIDGSTPGCVAVIREPAPVYPAYTAATAIARAKIFCGDVKLEAPEEWHAHRVGDWWRVWIGETDQEPECSNGAEIKVNDGSAYTTGINQTGCHYCAR